MKIKRLLILSAFLTLALTPGLAAAGYYQQWVSSYQGAGTDDTYDIALDASGNVYVTGYSATTATGSDFLTIKYNQASGDTVWARRFTSPGANDDQATAIAIDASGNIYVAGGVYYSPTDAGDFLVIKYNPANGDTIWTREYTGAGSDKKDQPYDIALDASGNVFVTGFCGGDKRDVMTIKYNSAGEQQWVKFYNSPDNGNDEGHVIATGSSGVYVAGSSDAPDESNTDYLLVKLDAATGDTIWTRRINGTGNSGDAVTDMVLDASENIFLTGKSIGPATEWDAMTVKYTSSGSPLWTSRYNNPGNTDDIGEALVLDASDNVYVVGSSYNNTGGVHPMLIKYNSSGVQQYVKCMNDPGTLLDVTFTDKGLFASGSIKTPSDYLTVEYDPASGDTIWMKTYSGASDGFDQAKYLAVDTAGNVFVTGSTYGGVSTGYDITTLKYAPLDCQPDNQIKAQADASYIGDDIYTFDGTSQTKSLAVEQSSTVIYDIKIENDGNVKDTFKVTGTAGTSDWVVTYYDALASGNNITSQITGSGWITPELSSGSAVEIRVEVTPMASVADGASFDVLVTSLSKRDTTMKDAVKAHTIAGTSGVEDSKVKPLLTFLETNNTSIAYGLSSATFVKLIIYNASGCKVATIDHGQRESGIYEFSLTSASLYPGVYFARLETNATYLTKKIVIVK